MNAFSPEHLSPAAQLEQAWLDADAQPWALYRIPPPDSADRPWEGGAKRQAYAAFTHIRMGLNDLFLDACDAHAAGHAADAAAIADAVAGVNRAIRQISFEAQRFIMVLAFPPPYGGDIDNAWAQYADHLARHLADAQQSIAAAAHRVKLCQDPSMEASADAD